METLLAPWIAAQRQQLMAQRAHAWLLHGPSGLGQYTLALELARAWLCDAPSADGACAACPSCHAIDVRTHADLCVLMPETTALEKGWPLGEKAQSDIDEKKRKPSKEIRVEAMRDAIEFVQRSNARGRGKVVLVYPAERMNAVTANALLKTLEEPPGDVRFVLASESAHQLLPTIRSRCIGHAMQWPAADQARSWLLAQAVDAAAVDTLLRASGERPDDAVRLQAEGATLWDQLPRAVAQGQTSYFKDWGAAQLVDALQKLCHDALAVQVGAEPRYFRVQDLDAHGSLVSLSAWSRALAQERRHIEHPFNPGLLLEALVEQGRAALHSEP